VAATAPARPSTPPVLLPTNASGPSVSSTCVVFFFFFPVLIADNIVMMMFLQIVLMDGGVVVWVGAEQQMCDNKNLNRSTFASRVQYSTVQYSFDTCEEGQQRQRLSVRLAVIHKKV
jgi:hypothetical protein